MQETEVKNHVTHAICQQNANMFPWKNNKDKHDMLNQKKKWRKTQKGIIHALGAGTIFHAAYVMGVSIVTHAVSG